MPSRRLLVTLLVLVFFMTQFSGPYVNRDSIETDYIPMEQATEFPDAPRTEDKSVIAADPISGVLDPVVIEQYGYSGTGLLEARTDSCCNDQSSILIDNETGWVGSQAQLEIWNMERLYAQNGTLDDGISGTNYYPSATNAYPYGWSLDWDDPSSGLQNVSATYDKDNGYLVLENKAELAAPPPSYIVEYRHWDGTYIYWNQTIHNVPYSDNLTLSFMYNYDSGIIDSPPIEVAGWVYLEVLIDGISEASIDLLTECPSRNTWYEFVVPNLLDLPSTFNLQIGIYEEAVTPPPTDYFVTNPGADYDGDSELDLGLAQISRVFIDNISLLSETQPSYDEVDLTFNAGVFSSAITEFSNYGTAVITNPSYWDDSYLDVGISANVSVSFDYEVKLFSQNFGNSLWTSQPTKQGVSYAVDAGASAELSVFTYVGNEGVAIYENFTVELYLPPDWENVTVFDPFLNDVTGLCTFAPGSLEIPNSILDRLGWWQITLNSPNYAESINAQIDNGGWIDSTLFRPTNHTRVSVTLGTASETPIIVDSVNVTWFTPDDTVWSQDSPSTGSGGVVNSDPRTLGGLNTTAGQWTIVAEWMNGTEIAYGSSTFDMYHTASLVVPAEYTTIQTDVGLTISNFVYYTDADTSDYLLDDSITITANWTGSTIPFTQDLVKNWWRGEFDTSLVEGGQYTVVVTATRPYFDEVSTQFTVVATQQMTLEILNAGSIPIERGMYEVFTVQMDYELLNGTGIPGADIFVSHSGPGGGLTWDNFADNNNGHYSVDIICDHAATYPITITLNKTFYHGASDSLTLIIGETGTTLSSLNGTADILLYGGNYTLVLEYLNSTGDGLSGANLQVISKTPAIGLNDTGFTPLSDGLYTITLTPTSAGSFSIVMSASLLDHETQYITFTLTATGIPSVLTVTPSSASIAIGQNITIQLEFNDESFNGIDPANISVLNLPSGLSIIDIQPLGNGLFNYTLFPLEINTFDTLFRASAINYQSSSAAFTLVVTEVETRIAFEGDVSSVLVEFEEPYLLTVYYYRLDSVTNVAGANVSVLTHDTGLNITVREYVGYYLISIRGKAIGSWSLTITANKTDHLLATKQFLFQVEEIETDVEGSSPLEALLVGRTYSFTFSYLFESNSSFIRAAEISPFGEGADWFSFAELGSGQYSVNLTPQALGEFEVSLVFQKFGFELSSYRISFTVEEVPISVEVIQGLVGPEMTSTTLEVRVTESDTGNAVSGALVYCRIIDPNGIPGESIVMDETSTAGVYSTTISMPIAEGVYYIQISCVAENFILDEPLSAQLYPGRDVGTMLMVTTTRYWPILVALGAVCAGLVYRRSARKRRVRQNKITLAIKRRFDDVRTLLGVIVIHKDSGLPVYSKILRDGLEEAVISAFITAVTSFRGEFDIESTTEEWGLIPISDIVRVVSTNRLICAFITTGNPSPEQRERMIKFAKTVGFIFDDTMDDVPIVILDHHTTMQFDSLFDDILDGALLRTYKLDDAQKFPTATCADERIARKHGEEFKLEELANEIAACGLEEGRVYQAIMKALENHLLVTTDESPFTTEIVRAPDIVEEEG
ncbi:MAG: hypothetical protein ACFFEE_06185 [Candidatus Thorarchaeota archaeon]